MSSRSRTSLFFFVTATVALAFVACSGEVKKHDAGSSASTTPTTQPTTSGSPSATPTDPNSPGDGGSIAPSNVPSNPLDDEIVDAAVNIDPHAKLPTGGGGPFAGANYTCGALGSIRLSQTGSAVRGALGPNKAGVGATLACTAGGTAASPICTGVESDFLEVKGKPQRKGTSKFTLVRQKTGVDYTSAAGALTPCR